MIFSIFGKSFHSGLQMNWFGSLIQAWKKFLVVYYSHYFAILIDASFDLSKGGENEMDRI